MATQMRRALADDYATNQPESEPKSGNRRRTGVDTKELYRKLGDLWGRIEDGSVSLDRANTENAIIRSHIKFLEVYHKYRDGEFLATP